MKVPGERAQESEDPGTQRVREEKDEGLFQGGEQLWVAPSRKKDPNDLEKAPPAGFPPSLTSWLSLNFPFLNMGCNLNSDLAARGGHSQNIEQPGRHR